jgi:cadmium resistance protein CadD (predicted permease)
LITIANRADTRAVFTPLQGTLDVVDSTAAIAVFLAPIANGRSRR